MKRLLSLTYLRILICIGLVPIALHGCAVGPDYHRPESKLPAQWSESPTPGTALVPMELSRWWTVFNDPLLDSIIDRAAESNKDLKIAEARIREARASRRLAVAELWPRVDSRASYSRSKRSETTGGNQGDGNGGSGRKPSTGSTSAVDQDLFQVGLDAAWEINLFGGRREVEAADADLASFVENYRDVLVTLLSEVALNYLDVRGNQLRIEIALKNIEIQKRTVELTQARFEAGLSSDLDVTQARAQLAETESRVPALETAVRQSIHRLGVLVGQPPGAVSEELSKEAPLPAAAPDVPLGLPSDLLRRRPDVRRAERQLAASTARIGVAVADLFPKFSLTGSFSQQSAGIADLVSPASRAWSIGPSIFWPIFDAGRIRANIQIQDARQEQALAQYEQAVLRSLEDVENALVAYSKEQATRRSLVDAVAANSRAVEIANELYSMGLVDFLNVLRSQGALYLAQDQLARSNQSVSSDLVSLFKALGGGWDVPDQNPL